MALRLTHITIGKMGVFADSTEELSAAIDRVTAAGYTTEDREDDPDEPRFVVTVAYPRNPTHFGKIRALLK